MEFINRTGNSVYIEDIDLNISFDGHTVEKIDADEIKKSNAFQQLAILGAFEIVKAGPERIEQNLVRLQSEQKKDEPTEIEPDMPSGDEPEVVIKGHFYEAGGYAKVNRNLAIGLSKAGVKVEIKPVGSRRNDLNEMEVRMLGNLKQRMGRDAIKIDSIIPSMSDISPRSSWRILYTTIEATTIPQQTVDICNQYDEIWVTSDFCRDILKKYKIKPEILVLPSSINVALYNEKHKPHAFRPALKKFSFISVFGWSYRKGNDALLRAYLEEFKGSEDVSLLIVSRFQNVSERSQIIRTEIQKAIEKYGGEDPAHIARCSKVIPEFQMPSIYRACNAFVLPTRGEGFGLPYAESSLCGLPVIATNHSGQTMFMTKSNSYLVDIDRMEKVQRGRMHVHYWDDQEFPALNTNDFIRPFRAAMRDCYENYAAAVERNKDLQEELKTNYSVTAVCNKAKERLAEIWDRRKAKV